MSGVQESPSVPLGVGIDTGGHVQTPGATFTDLVALGVDGSMRVANCPVHGRRAAVAGVRALQHHRRRRLPEAAAERLLPTAYCLLPTAYCLLPTARASARRCASAA